MAPTSTQEYITLLEKTNLQLSLWYNPYGIMVGILTLLVAVLAIYFAYILWRQGRDYRDFLEEQKMFIREDAKSNAKVVLDEYIQRTDEKLQTATGEARVKIETELANLKEARESLNLRISHPITKPLGYSVIPQEYYSLDGVQKTLTDAQVRSILALLESFGADGETISNVKKALVG